MIDHPAPSFFSANPSNWLRAAILLFTLAAFLRLMWQLDDKALWWDESLTLQRAESPFSSILMGTLLIKDGLTDFPTTDQHPPLYFMLTGLLIRYAGISEVALRFVAVMSATALIPVVSIFTILLSRKQIAPQSTPYWAAMLASTSPFFLWYGQEARPYSLWALLAIISTYWLWRLIDDNVPGSSADIAAVANARMPFRRIFRFRSLFIYSATLLLFLISQYYAIFLLPLHGIMIYTSLARHNCRVATLVAGTLAILGTVFGTALGWYILSQTGGENFEQIPLKILLPDMLNAFSMGLSVDINAVWWLDIIIGCVALLGAFWSVRSPEIRKRGGWVVPQLVLIPVTALLLINLFHPAYMNARHISLIGGGYLIAVATGLALLHSKQQWLGTALALLIFGGASYSTINYFTVEIYDKDDYHQLAEYIESQLLPGDLVLLNPAASWRIFDYYLPLEWIDSYNHMHANSSNVLPTDYYGIPLLGLTWEALFSQIDQWKSQYRRIWVIKSGTNPFMDRENQIDPWLDENLYRLSQKRFFSHSALRASMYMAEPPVYNEPIPIDGLELDLLFGQQIRLIGIDIAEPLTQNSPLPVTLFWKTTSETDIRYKSILRVLMTNEVGQEVELGITEREPYDGVIATEYWVPRQTIVEMTGVPPYEPWPADRPLLQLHVQLYRTDTLEQQPIESKAPLPQNTSISENALTLVIHVQ